MYPSKSILVKQGWKTHLNDDEEEDDLSTLSGSPTNVSKRLQGNLKNRLKPFSMSECKNLGVLQSKSVTESGHSVPFDEVPMSVDRDCVQSKNDDNNDDCEDEDENVNYEDDGDDDDDDEGILGTWEVQPDGTLELVQSRPKNKFEKSKKSAFVPTATNEDNTSIDNTSVVSGLSAVSKSNEIKRQTKLERLRKRKGGRLLSKTSMGKKIEKYAEYMDRQKSIKKESESENTGDSDIIEQSMTQLQITLQEATSVIESNKKLIDEITNPESNKMVHLKTVDSTSDALHPMTPIPSEDANEGCKNTKPLIENKNHPKSPQSSFSSGTRTTEGTSTTTAQTTNFNGYAPLDTKRLKQRFHNKSTIDNPTLNASEFSRIPQSPGDDLLNFEKKPSFDNLNSPPHLRRRQNFPLLTEVSSGTMPEIEEFPHRSKNMTLEAEELNAGQKASKSSRDSMSNPLAHTINVSIALSCDSMSKLEKILDGIKTDLAKYEDNNTSLLLTTSSNSDLKISQQLTISETEDIDGHDAPVTSESDVLSMSTQSLIQNFRQAVKAKKTQAIAK